MCKQENLGTYSAQELLVSLKSMRSTESHVIAEIVRYLAEIDSRKAYREYGYSSLYSFCTEGLKYSEGAAQRRIVAARCLRDNPEVYQLLEQGKVSLCSLSEVAKVITKENKTEILALTEGLPKLEAQRLAARYSAPLKPVRETIRAKKVILGLPRAEFTATVAVKSVVEERFSINIEVDAECMELINQAKRYAGERKLGQLLKVVLKDYVERKRPKAVKRERQTPAKSTRYIPRHVKDAVRLRDDMRCTYVSADGKRCSERFKLEFDHQVPHACGGESSLENLRLTCRAHNQLYAESHFGLGFMQAKAERNSST